MHNTTSLGAVINTVQPKRSKAKAMGMRFDWLRDRAAQSQFRWLWRPGTTNLVDYYTKHHCPVHHNNMRAEVFTLRGVLEALRKKFDKLPPVFSASERVC